MPTARLPAPLTDPDTRIAIFSKGHYEYSLIANDYLVGKSR